MPGRPATPLQSRRADQRGQVLVLFVITLVVLLVISALAVDYGSWLVAKRSYQTTADAAALAGAQQLTRPLSSNCPTGNTKNFCARKAAWDSIKRNLGLTTLDPATRAAGPFTTAYIENGYSIWVASPPSDANVGCSSNCPYPGHTSGPGTVFVRVEHPAAHYLSRIAFPTDSNATAWATAGRFPANFAVVGLCRPTTSNCLGNDDNIKVDGNGSLLAVSTGDLGTNAWTKTNGTNTVIGLGPDSNAYEEMFETCWGYSTNQCQLATYSGGAVDYSSQRAATPVGAPIVDPGYTAPPINSTTTPGQCKGSSGSLAYVPLEGPPIAAAEPPLKLVSIMRPVSGGVALAAAGSLTGFVKSQATNAALGSINVTIANGTNSYTDTTQSSGGNAGKYSVKPANGTYTITAVDPTGTYRSSSLSGVVFSGSDLTAADIKLQKNPILTGTVRDATTNAVISGAAITISGASGPYTTTTDVSGAYTQVVSASGSYTVQASKSGYVTNSNSGTGAYDTTTTVNVSLSPSPASVSGTISDSTTGLKVPGVTVTLNTGELATTGSDGTYSIGTTGQGTKTFTLSGSALTGYAATSSTGTVAGSTSALSASWQLSGAVSGATTGNFNLWPKGCASSSVGNWSCAYPSGSNCPTATNTSGATVSCTFTQANAIRPGTYRDISIDGCAWIDPKGGVTGLGTGQSAGIIHVTGKLSLSNNSYLFGDGVTIVMDSTASIDVNNGGGFVLNFGSKVSGGSCDYSTIKEYGDGSTPCFRTVSDGNDYAYAAWTTKGRKPWECSGTSTTTYSTSCLSVGSELGITFYLYGSSSSRFKLSTASMGYLFNGVLYGPNDDIALGGGKNGQSAAGQIVGWTIEYHGGTKIIQRWYGDPVDGPPFLIEPILGECVLPIGACS